MTQVICSTVKCWASNTVLSQVFEPLRRICSGIMRTISRSISSFPLLKILSQSGCSCLTARRCWVWGPCLGLHHVHWLPPTVKHMHCDLSVQMSGATDGCLDGFIWRRWICPSKLSVGLLLVFIGRIVNSRVDMLMSSTCVCLWCGSFSAVYPLQWWCLWWRVRVFFFFFFALVWNKIKDAWEMGRSYIHHRLQLQQRQHTVWFLPSLDFCAFCWAVGNARSHWCESSLRWPGQMLLTSFLHIAAVSQWTFNPYKVCLVIEVKWMGFHTCG